MQIYKGLNRDLTKLQKDISEAVTNNRKKVEFIWTWCFKRKSKVDIVNKKKKNIIW